MREALHPVRRDLDFMPLRHRGETLLLVRDHLGFVPEGKALPVRLYEMLALLDQAPDLRELQTALIRRAGGVLVSEDEIKGIIDALDELYLLDSPRFRERLRLLREEFRSLCTRAPSHCGISYPSTSNELKEMIASVLNDKGFPKLKPPKAIIAPHIDLSVGRELYGKAYASLRGFEIGRVIILGVGHRMEGGMFSLTAKDYETPLGRLETDRKAVERLLEAGRNVVEEDDFAHKSEHSIEFQVLFLQEALRPGFKIVPILCGNPALRSPAYNRDAFLSEAGSFISELRQLVSSKDGENLVVAGVDFSHIGPKFGHDLPASALAAEAQAHDTILLKRIMNLDAEGFWLESLKVRDRYNVCGFSALATAIEILPPCSGTLLDYKMWKEDATSSAVSFAAALFGDGP